MSDTQHDDEPATVAMSLTMHDRDEIILTTQALGLKPTAVLEFVPGPDDYSLDIKVDVYGVGTSKEDVLNLGELLRIVADGIAEKAESAYSVAMVERPDGDR